MKKTPPTTDIAAFLRPGQTFRDRDHQRWFVKGLRPGSDKQYVIEAEMKGSYPRVGLYAMTEREFRACAREAGLKPEKSGRPTS